MLYDVNLNRGIRKKSLPEPNPPKIELPKDSDYHTVVEKAKDLYFSERIPEDEDDEGSTVMDLLLVTIASLSDQSQAAIAETSAGSKVRIFEQFVRRGHIRRVNSAFEALVTPTCHAHTNT